VFCAVLMSLIAGVASADETAADEIHPYLTDEFGVQLGFFRPNKSVVFRYDQSALAPGLDIDFERDLRLSGDRDLFALEFVWRYGEKWSLRGQYFEASNRGSRTLSEDITWGDVTIVAGSSVSAGTDFEMARVFWARKLDSAPQHNYGWGVGLHRLQTGAFIRGELVVESVAASQMSAKGPLPNIGAWYYYSPNERWFIGGRLDWFSASVGDYSGSIKNLAVGANYQVARHLGIGVKYQDFELDADVKKSNQYGRVSLDFEGAYVYLSGNW